MSCVRRNLAIKSPGLNSRGRIQAIRKLTRMEIVSAPSPTQYRLAVSEQIIGGAQARLVEQFACREAAQWNGLVLGVP